MLAAAATDLDVCFVETALLHQRNATVLQHDLLRDRLPEASFDLVHARLLLAWLAEPSLCLKRLVAALKPGGWLLAEEMDCISVVASGDRDAGRAIPVSGVLNVLHTLLDGRRAFDAAFGRRLHADLESAGLTRVLRNARGHLVSRRQRQPFVAADARTAARTDGYLQSGGFGRDRSSARTER